MPETYKEYPIMELTLALESYKDLASGHERCQEGDIVNVRRPKNGTGLGVPKEYLKILVDGFEKNEFDRLTQPIGSGVDENGDVIAPFFDKRRYCVPLEKLNLDLVRAKDKNDVYQPFLLTDTDEPFLFLEQNTPLNVYGLIFDKLKGQFI